MESFDPFVNLQKILQFVDPHLSLLVIEHYEQSNHFSKQQIHNEKILVLSKTKMNDLFIEEVEKTPKEGASKDQIERLIKDANAAKESISKSLDKFYTISEEFVKPILEDVEKYTNLEKEKFQKTAVQNAFDGAILRKEVLMAALRFTRLNFDIGQYPVAQKILNCLVNLLEEDALLIDALRGKLVSDLILENYTDNIETVKALRAKIEEQKIQGGTMQVLGVRVQLLHTALFAFLHPRSSEGDYEQLVELFSSEKLFNSIPIGAPHLIRYLISALLLIKNNTKNKNFFNLNTVAGYLPTLSTTYRESLTDFIREVLLDYDFKKASASLKKIRKELESDYFLGKKADQIIGNAQTLFFETFCKVYRKVDLKFVAEFLEVQTEEAEVWIVNLIRVLGMEAKLDLDKGCLILTTNPRNLYETVLQRTRDTIPRTSILINSVNRILQGESN